MFRKFLLYGIAGWAVEVVFTGAASAIFGRDRSATAKTYLWMHPIYGGTALLLEALSRRVRRAPLPARAAAYTAVMVGAEYASGWILRRALGRCPWDYSGSGRDVHGLVRLDYLPAWYGLGLLFERVSAQMDRLDGVTRAATASIPAGNSGARAPALPGPEAGRSGRTPPPSPAPADRG